MGRSGLVQLTRSNVGGMRTRSLIVLVVIMAVISGGVWLMAGDNHNAIADWFASLHGRPGGGH